MSELIQKLLQTSVKSGDFKKILKELSNNSFNNFRQYDLCSQLTDKLTSINWQIVINSEDNMELLDSLFDIISEIIAFHPIYLKKIFKSIVIKLFSSEICANEDDDTLSSIEIKIFSKCHEFMKELLITYPNQIDDCFILITTGFPYYLSSCRSYSNYFSNVLKSYHYIKGRHRYLGLIIGKLVFLELTSMSNDNMSSSTQNENVKKIFNRCFVHFLKFTEELCFPEGNELDVEKVDEFVDHLLVHTTNLVLPAEDCKLVLLIIPYIGSFGENICTRVIETLWLYAISSKEIVTNAQRKAIYLITSMLLRATYIDDNFIFGYIEYSLNWAREYIEINALSNNITNFNTKYIHRHGVFYAICESTFELIAYKHMSFDDTKIRRIRSANLQTIIGSSLNPLAFCSPLLLQKFAEVCRHYRFAMCSVIIERNRRSDSQGQYPLNSESFYHPFDSLSVIPDLADLNKSENSKMKNRFLKSIFNYN